MEKHTIEFADGSKFTGMIGTNEAKTELILDCGLIKKIRIKADSARHVAELILELLDPVEQKDCPRCQVGSACYTHKNYVTSNVPLSPTK